VLLHSDAGLGVASAQSTSTAMPLLPLNDDTDTTDDAPVTLTGIEVSGGNREQILEALRLNRTLLHEPQPDAEVDETAVRTTIDKLLDRLSDTS
jgi:hypothetical protein